jgi:hypothetical protein
MILWALAWPGAALAQPAPPPHVVMAAPPRGTDDLRALIVAEMAAMGVVVRVETSEHDGEADAVLRLVDEPRSVTVWTASTMRLRSYAADPRRPAGSDEALARQVAEVLRAELLLRRVARPPVAAAPPPRESVAPPPQPPVQPLPQRAPLPPPRIESRPRKMAPAMGSLGAAPAMTLSPGPLPTFAQVQADVQLFVWRRMRLQAFGVFPVTSVVLQDDRGDIVASSTVIGGSLGYELLGGAPLSLTPSLGLGWHSLGVTGRANAPLASSRDRADTALWFGALDVQYALASWLSLTAGLRVGVVTPSLRIAIAGDDLGSFGQPLAQLSAGLAVPIRGVVW